MSVVVRLPPELRAKIAPLLKMQASDSGGERANASAAIGRLLKNHGFDWHDLTEALLAEPTARAPESQSNDTSWRRSAGAVDLPRADLIALLDIVETKSPFLAIKSATFVSSLRERAWRPMVHLSERQWCWLQDLLEATRV